jgi:nitrate/nitrite-specific signal transduction histidine kinase
MSKPEDKSNVPELDLAASKREFIETFFKRGAEFTEELIRENERLRYQIVKLEEQNRTLLAQERPGSAGSSLRELVSRIESLEAERDQLIRRFESVPSETRDLLARFAEIERENNNLANLYVASYQLHSTGDLREVTHVILEILLNFIGARTFSIQLVDDEHKKIRTLASEGVEREKVPEPRLGEGRIGEVLASGKTFVDESRLRSRAELDKPVVVVPLRIRDKVVGVIVIWDLLQQKTQLAEVDHELFNLLGAEAGFALQGAKLVADLDGRPPALWAAADLV